MEVDFAVSIARWFLALFSIVLAYSSGVRTYVGALFARARARNLIHCKIYTEVPAQVECVQTIGGEKLLLDLSVMNDWGKTRHYT